MFPGWRRTKSASSFSHSGSDRKMDQVISQLTSKQVPLTVESVSTSDTPTNSPTKPANRGTVMLCIVYKISNVSHNYVIE